MGGGNLSEQEIRSDSILGDNVTFCKTIVQPCELTLASGATRAVSHTDTVVQMKNSIIKLLFVNCQGIILT